MLRLNAQSFKAEYSVAVLLAAKVEEKANAEARRAQRFAEIAADNDGVVAIPRVCVAWLLARKAGRAG